MWSIMARDGHDNRWQFDVAADREQALVRAAHWSAVAAAEWPGMTFEIEWRCPTSGRVEVLDERARRALLVADHALATQRAWRQIEDIVCFYGGEPEAVALYVQTMYEKLDMVCTKLGVEMTDSVEHFAEALDGVTRCHS